MPGPISIGDVAPNFDLSSTEEALLMLKDEVTRTALVIYFFADPESDRVQRDLDALSHSRDALVKLQTRVLAVSPAKLDDLKKLQKDGDITEDDERRDSEAVQKATDASIAEIDQLLATKEKEITQV